jgi:CTD kinase subunit gamma
MQNKSFLEAQAVTEIEEVLKDRDASAQDISMSSPPPHAADMPPSRTLLPTYNKRSNAPPRLDKKQIEQRIEEDRERHKREREHIWAVPPGEDAEMEKLWDETSDLGEDDHRMGEEEWAEWKAEHEARRCVHQREETNGTR